MELKVEFKTDDNGDLRRLDADGIWRKIEWMLDDDYWLVSVQDERLF